MDKTEDWSAVDLLRGGLSDQEVERASGLSPLAILALRACAASASRRDAVADRGSPLGPRLNSTRD